LAQKDKKYNKVAPHCEECPEETVQARRLNSKPKLQSVRENSFAE